MSTNIVKSLKWYARRDFVLLKTPKKKESKILMSPEAEAELNQQLLKELKVLEVAAAGPDSSLEDGDKVPVNLEKLEMMDIIEIDGHNYLIGIDSWFPVVMAKK